MVLGSLAAQPPSEQARYQEVLAMKRLRFVSLFAVLPIAAQSGPLAVVDVGAPAIHCLFTTASPCTVTVSDTVARFR